MTVTELLGRLTALRGELSATNARLGLNVTVPNAAAHAHLLQAINELDAACSLLRERIHETERITQP